MNESAQKIVFSKNLNTLLSERRITQKEAADAVGVSPQTFNTWSKGIALPRMEKLEKLADYFSIPKFALFEEKRTAPVPSDEEEPMDAQLHRYTALMNNEGKERLISRARELIRLGYTRAEKKELPEKLLRSEENPEVHNETIAYYLL